MNKSYQQKLVRISQKYILLLAICLSFSFSFERAFASDVSENNVVTLINHERMIRNIKPLKIDSDLDWAANLKSKDMLNRNYFDHFALGLTPWDFIHISGYNYSLAGENLAMDFNTSEGMVQAWMNSPKHRDNILNPDFEDIGLGIVKGTFIEETDQRQTTMVTNLFGRKQTRFAAFVDKLVKGLFTF